MPTPHFLPSADAELLNWSANFSAKLSASPASYGITAPQATAYAALHSTFASALTTATDPATNSKTATVAKNQAKSALMAQARVLAREIQGTPTVTNEQRSDLGLTVRDTEPSPIPPPETAPDIDLVATMGRTVKIKLHGSRGDRRGKPAGVAGATILSFVGEDPPQAPSQWTFMGNTTKTTCDVDFPATVPGGSKVWLTAFWYNPRAESGPAANPVFTRIAEGMAEAA